MAGGVVTNRRGGDGGGGDPARRDGARPVDADGPRALAQRAGDALHGEGDVVVGRWPTARGCTAGARPLRRVTARALTPAAVVPG